MARIRAVQESLEQLRQDENERLRLIVESAVDYEQYVVDEERRQGYVLLGAVDRESGVRIEDVGAGLAEHQDRHEHDGLSARHDHDGIR